MQIEQRRITRIDLHDGKARCFVLQREDPGYKLSAVSKDDVLHIVCSAQDLQRMRQEVMRPEYATPWKGHVAPETWATRTSYETESFGHGHVRIDHRQVTTVALSSGKVHHCSVEADARGYLLTCTTPDEVLHVHLPAHDLYRLRDVLRPEPVTHSYVTPTAEPITVSTQNTQGATPFRWTKSEWLAYN